MSVGLVGRKCGMTRIFTEEGISIPVTVVEVEPNRILRFKTEQMDGYDAVQVTRGEKRQNRVNRPKAGEYRKAGVTAGVDLREFRINRDEARSLAEAKQITVDIFSAGQHVDVTGVTKGKGFAGTIKRHNFRSGDATHGNSLAHRVPGSIGQCQTPGRVFKGKRMAGQMGNQNRTVQGLRIVDIDAERNLLLVKGALPGPKGGDLLIRPSVKSGGKG